MNAYFIFDLTAQAESHILLDSKVRSIPVATSVFHCIFLDSVSFLSLQPMHMLYLPQIEKRT